MAGSRTSIGRFYCFRLVGLACTCLPMCVPPWNDDHASPVLSSRLSGGRACLKRVSPTTPTAPR